MILFFTSFKRILSALLAKIPLKIFVHIFSLVVVVLLLYISSSYLTRFLDMNTAINNFSAGDFATSLRKFEEPQKYIAIDSWKNSFNAGVASYMLNNQDDARDKFNKAKSDSAYLNSTEISCMIDVNIAFSLEKSGVTLKDTSAFNARDLRFAASYLLQAYTLRQNIMRDCKNMNPQDFKTNNENSDMDRTQYSEMMQNAFAIDGQNVNSEIEQSASIDDFEKRESNLNASEDTTKSLDPKLKQLVNENLKAQIDYQNAQNFKNKTNTQTKTPW